MSSSSSNGVIYETKKRGFFQRVLRLNSSVQSLVTKLDSKQIPWIKMRQKSFRKSWRKPNLPLEYVVQQLCHLLRQRRSLEFRLDVAHFLHSKYSRCRFLGVKKQHRGRAHVRKYTSRAVIIESLRRTGFWGFLFLVT